MATRAAIVQITPPLHSLKRSPQQQQQQQQPQQLQKQQARQMTQQRRQQQQQQQQQQQSRNTARLNNSHHHDTRRLEKEERASVAGACALVGECVHIDDSNLNYNNHKQQNNKTGRASSTRQLQQQQQHQQQKAPPQRKQEVLNDMSVGLMATGLAWVQRQRAERQRQNLQHQAEMQVKKILTAQQQQLKEHQQHHQHQHQHQHQHHQQEMYLDQSCPMDACSDEPGGMFGNQIFQMLSSSDGDNHQHNQHNHQTSIQSTPAGGISSYLFNGQEDNDSSNHSYGEDNIQTKASVSQSGDGISVSVQIPLEPEGTRLEEQQDDEDDYSWIPQVRIAPETMKKEEEPTPFILSETQRQQIAVQVLPETITYCPWKRLYSLARDGDSFEACLRLIDHSPRTLLVVRTSRGAIFGAYSDSPWDDKAEFHGSARSVLFTFFHQPDDKTTKSPTAATPKIKVYKWTGANRYIQYCDHSRQMLAFGGGGDNFGLCVENEFQQGSTGSCETFGNEPLCDQENFYIVDVEIYGFLTGQF